MNEEQAAGGAAADASEVKEGTHLAATDLAGIGDDTEVTTDVDVVFNDDGEPVSGFKVVGANSKAYQQATRKVDVGNVRRAHVRGKLIDPKTEDGAAMLVDGASLREMAIACACTVGLYGFNKGGGPVPALTPELLKDVFTKRPTWRKKVVAAVEAEANFSKKQ